MISTRILHTCALLVFVLQVGSEEWEDTDRVGQFVAFSVHVKTDIAK